MTKKQMKETAEEKIESMINTIRFSSTIELLRNSRSRAKGALTMIAKLELIEDDRYEELADEIQRAFNTTMHKILENEEA